MILCVRFRNANAGECFPSRAEETRPAKTSLTVEATPENVGGMSREKNTIPKTNRREQQRSSCMRNNHERTSESVRTTQTPEI